MKNKFNLIKDIVFSILIIISIVFSVNTTIENIDLKNEINVLQSTIEEHDTCIGIIQIMLEKQSDINNKIIELLKK